MKMKLSLCLVAATVGSVAAFKAKNSSQGEAMCAGCKEKKNGLLSTGIIDSIGLGQSITFAQWKKPYEVEKYCGAMFVSFNDLNFFQPWSGPIAQGYMFGSGSQENEIYQYPYIGEWRHYACTWNGVTGEVHYYIDGVKTSTDTGKGVGKDFGTEAGLNMYIGTPGYGWSDTADTYLIDRDKVYHGLVDEVRVYNKILSPAEIAEIADPLNSKAWGKQTGADQPLLHYTFDVADGASTTGVPNVGSAPDHGLYPNFDGQEGAFTARKNGGTCEDDTQAVGHEIVSQTDASSCATAPKPIARDFSVTFAEDFSQPLRLAFDGGESSTGEFLIATITKMPQNGKIYHAKYSEDPPRPVKEEETPGDEITAAGTVVKHDGSRVFYVPNTDGSGLEFDTIGYTLSDDCGASSEATITLNVLRIDDKPSTVAAGDDHGENTEDDVNGTVYELVNIDAEADSLASVITELPSNGKLYVLTDCKNETCKFDKPIESEYNPFSALETIDQFVHEVNTVSSFWGGPPYAGYHALNVIGKPTCDGSGYGECTDSRSWVKDCTVPVDNGIEGELVLAPRPGGYEKSLGRISKVLNQSTVVVSFYILQKEVNETRKVPHSDFRLGFSCRLQCHACSRHQR